MNMQALSSSTCSVITMTDRVRHANEGFCLFVQVDAEQECWFWAHKLMQENG